MQTLESQRYSEREVSLLAKGEEGTGRADSPREGAAWGAGAGATAGILASVGALAIPGIGPILAAGPIAATLTGVGMGGIAGGLMDWGIPAQTGKRLESDIKRGEAVVLVRSSAERVEEAARRLRELGAHDVEVHDAQ